MLTQQDVTHLRELRIRDFALIADQTISFMPGLNVITGESGSGKSVLVEALSLILGSPAPANCVRAPAGMASIQGTYTLDAATAVELAGQLRALGIPDKALLPLVARQQQGAAGAAATGSSHSSHSSGAAATANSGGAGAQLVLRRELVAQGGLRPHSRCTINGAPTSLRALKELGRRLVDANAQNASLAMKDAGTQLRMLDQLAGAGATTAAGGRHLLQLASAGLKAL